MDDTERGLAVDRAARPYPFGEPDRLELDPMYAYLQQHEPLSRVSLPYGEDAWLAVRYHDVRTVLGDARFSRAAAVGRDVPRLHPEIVSNALLDLDPPEHGRLRRLCAKAFTVRRVEQLRLRAREVADNLLDAAVAAGPEMDLVEDFAVPLPGIMICELLGVPYAERDDFREWAEAFVSMTTLTAEQRQTYLRDLGGYLATLVAKRRAIPADDLISALVAARDENDGLTEQEIIGLAVFLLAAGYETTATQIATFMYALLTHPDQLELLRARPELIPSAVEELLRWVPLTATAAALPRYATQDIRLSSGSVRAGDAVLTAKHIANRDPEMFEDPDRLDVTREVKSHLAFGHGVHHCIGAQLARMDLQTALQALLERCPEMRFAGAEDQLEWKTGLAGRGLVGLPVSW